MQSPAIAVTLRKILRLPIVALLILVSIPQAAHSSKGKAKQFNTPPSLMPDIAFTAPQTPLDPKAKDGVDPSVAVIELNEIGELWTGCGVAHPSGAAECQPDYAVEFIANARKHLPSGGKLVVLTFVHGWTHNAEWRDANFIHLREAVDCLNWGKPDYDRVYGGFPRKIARGVYHLGCEGLTRRVNTYYVGVYIGWQGTPKNLSTGLLTLPDRYKVAEDTAAYPRMADIFARLKGAAKDPIDGTQQAKLVIAGHSLGGLIVEKTTKAILDANNSDYSKLDCKTIATSALRPADLILLINPASNATRAVEIINAMKQKNFCHDSSIAPSLFIPLIISIHSDTDEFTGKTGNILRQAIEMGPPPPPSLTIDKDPRSLEPFSNISKLQSSTLNNYPFFLNLCFVDSSNMHRDGGGSKTGQDVCDRVAAEVKRAKLSGFRPPLTDLSMHDNTSPGRKAVNADKGAYELAAEVPASNPNELAGRRDALNRSLADLLAFPNANKTGAPNLLWDLYTRDDPGTGGTGASTASRVPPYNSTPYWAFNVSGAVIRGHSGFWTDEFTDLLNALMENAP